MFMWLVQYKKVLIQSNLINKGWTGSTDCMVCRDLKTVDHLMIQCSVVRQLWFWLGDCQEVFDYWHTIEDILTYSDNLQGSSIKTFLITFSALA